MTNISARRVFDMLRLIARASGPLSVSEISRQLNIPATTTHRGIVALEQTGYIKRHQASPQFVLGPASQRLPQAFFARFRLRELAIPYLRQLAVSTGETASLFVPIGWYGVRIASVKGMNEVIHTGPIGEARSLEDGMAAKAMLAYLPPDAQEAFFRHRFPPDDRSELERLKEDLKTIHQRSYAVEDSTRSNGVAVSFALRAGETMIAAIALEGPVIRLKDIGRPLPSEWDAARAEIETSMQERPDYYRNHYSHLDPADVVISARSPAASTRSNTTAVKTKAFSTPRANS